jgi:shikimate dehydrogenase
METERMRIGVVGHPIKHSLSAAMHNAVFRETRMGYKYEAFDVLPEDLGKFIESCREDFVGLNVTIPHKVEVIKYIDELSREAQMIGAVNTIKFFEGKSRGYNTDGLGCLKALESAGIGVEGKKILVLGAGGAARAIVYSCLMSGANVSIANRQIEKAHALSDEAKRKTGKKAAVIDYSFDGLLNSLPDMDVLINATSVGMTPNADESPVEQSLLHENLAVMDIVYNPVETKLLREAKENGCRTVSGVGMLVHQGAESLKIWFKLDAPVDVMEKEVLSQLTQ